MSAGGESKGSSGSGGGESKGSSRNDRGMRQASDPWGEKWASNPQTIANKHVQPPSLRQRTIPLRHGEWLGPRRALHLAEQLAPYGSRRREKDNKHTVRIGASNGNVALMHEGHKQLAALNSNNYTTQYEKERRHKNAALHQLAKKLSPALGGIKAQKFVQSMRNNVAPPPRTRPAKGVGLVGKLTKELQKAKNERPLPLPRLQRCVGRHCAGTGRYEGTPRDARDVRNNELRKNIRAIGRARKRTKRYNKVLKATRGRLPGGNHVPLRARRTIAEFATGAGNYSTKTGSTKSGGSTKSSGRWFEAGRKKKRRTRRRKKHRRTKRRRRRRRSTRRKR